MFCDCQKLTSLNLSGWNTEKVETMQNMFLACEKLIEINIEHFNTSSVENMKEMFNQCKTLTNLDLSNFDTSKTYSFYMDYFLSGSTSLHTLRLDNCSNDTINKIITSRNFPTFTDGSIHTIYCKRANASGLTPPQGWTFSYV